MRSAAIFRRPSGYAYGQFPGDLATVYRRLRVAGPAVRRGGARVVGDAALQRLRAAATVQRYRSTTGQEIYKLHVHLIENAGNYAFYPFEPWYNAGYR